MITDRLYALAESQPDAIALVFETRQYRYRELADMVSAMAARLHQAGVRPGDHIALMCGNRPAFLACWFALGELGAVCVPLNTGLVGEGFCYSLAKSESRLLIVEPELLAPRRDTLAAMEGAPPVLEIDAAMDLPPAEPPARWAGPPCAAGDLNSILFTSGTTGLPKGVTLPHGAYVAASDDMVQSLALTRADRILVFLPLFHANPQMYAVASVLGCGATLVLLRNFSASRFFDEAVAHGATGFTYVGTVLSILDKHYPEPRRDHALRWCVGGGAPARVWEAVESRFGISVRELYGMTETGGWVSMNTPQRARFGSVGHARAGIELAVVDEAGAPVAIGAKGEIVARSERPHVFFSEYWRNPEATAGTLKQGWLHTGDRGYLDEDGFLYFDGRQKELIRRGGEMIAPTEVEQQLLKHEQVRDCAVVGVPDDIMGEEVHAYVVLQGEPDAGALQAFLKARLPAYMAPRYFSFVPAIPKTETQKIKRHLLADLPAQVVDLAVARR
ncbi:class I adenylate-forming enzyme family protein [Bordetella bronchiseptica]|uniref:class I adenylate-forming enzyme family protein n=1 Tax=Bordetella bronchiseptica TaxID=518 RepID=UPI00028B0C32|nr:AMP-binding protein [Bordetella bronchiseptica]KCV24547.1 AMP-binding enzyme [Bordetella bronchiseptica 00-P-2730]KDD50864.1 AMP-binding enzyme [Bordetella bronchiseptica OSU553]AUL13948.1 ATP-dependent acyl-CoA ligase [Bordetella bronchiseptica]AWP57039.1 ATP-dependent acyl-CoA ligase [Bordetella bronchiseptica]AWQ03808.1 ATP-dependent acyl-CoA ligase [Bordetella bronchiseptica]